VSGSYDPGDIYLSRGLGKGKYAAIKGLVDEAKVPLVHHPVEFVAFTSLDDAKKSERDAVGKRVASFGSWPALLDWEGDGDLDMLIGTFGGDLYLRSNQGTRAKPAFAPETSRVEAGGAPIHVNGHANPVVADWDGDGLWDLVVSSSDGAVVWFKNEGTAKEPKLAQPEVLVSAKSKDKFLSRYLEPGQAPAPGVRAQICVTDYDGDGRQDLVLGDYCRYVFLKKLSPKERTEFDKLLQAEAAMIVKGGEVKPDTPEAKALDAEWAAVKKKKEALYADAKTEGTLSSFVWIYLRAPKK
jgi:FG-GAP-like repeat